ncbi:MAG TPA: prepilin-type N-terminal cleavage/methylation domain-containing protein [Candidatus Saccharimonadales bacterium]|jgi:general secretion pathway protein G
MNSLKKRTQQGFTIVELLIVIVVIGILAALVITTYNGIQQKGRNTERTTDLKAVQGQLEAYYAQTGRYPTGAADGSGLGSDSDNNVDFIAANMKGLDKEALRDPKAAAGDYGVGGAAAGVANKYQYRPTNDAGATCDNQTNDCTKYILTAEPEGNGTDIVSNSLN